MSECLLPQFGYGLKCPPKVHCWDLGPNMAILGRGGPSGRNVGHWEHPLWKGLTISQSKSLTLKSSGIPFFCVLLAVLPLWCHLL